MPENNNNNNMERINKQLEKILKELDNAIEDRDATKVNDVMTTKLGKVFKQSKGQVYSDILAQLNERVSSITNEMKPENGLDNDEVSELAGIRSSIISNKEPFQKTKDVVETLSKKGINQEDLKNYKDSQKKDNEIQIEAIKENNKELALNIIDIENRYVDSIKQNNQAKELISKIKKAKDTYTSLDATMDKDRIDSIKDEIRGNISELSSLGVDVASIQNFESNPNSIDAYHSTKIAELDAKSDTIATGIATDTSIPEKISKQYGLDAVTNADDLIKSYEKMVKQRQSNATKQTTLESENRQIDKTINELNKEEQIKSLGYNADNTTKTATEIANTVLRNPDWQAEVEGVVNGKYVKNKGLFKRTRSKFAYFKEGLGYSGFEAFKKTITNSFKKTKAIAMKTEASNFGMRMANKAYGSMEQRKSDFHKSLEFEVAKKMSKDNTLTANDLEKDVVDKAYKKALNEEER